MHMKRLNILYTSGVARGRFHGLNPRDKESYRQLQQKNM